MEQKIHHKDFDISWVTIVRIAVAIVFLYFLFLIRDIIIWFIFALIISVLFEPIVRILTKRKIPRVVVVVSIYFIIFGGLAYFLYLVLPFFISEVQEFSQLFPQQIPGYFERISPVFKGLGF